MSGGKETTTTSYTQMRGSSQNNPYFSTKTNANGDTTSSFKSGTAGETAYNFVNNNISQLLNNYLNPSLNSVTNQAKMATFNKAQQENLQNNIINPLTRNNMIRSSQATNLYNNLSNQAADYANQLIADDQANTWNMINNLMNLYTQGYTGISNEQSQGINASLGTGSTSSTSGK